MIRPEHGALATDHRPLTTLYADVLVLGGGAAGVAAAVTAAEAGRRVVLVERYGFCGGGAVAGLSGTICGLYEASENPGRPPVQVVHGFAQRFVTRLEALGSLGDPIRYGKTYTRVHEPLGWRHAADGLLREAGVTIIYHATAYAALCEGSERIEGVRLYTKQGPLDVRAAIAIDASGDADLVAMAGFSTFIGANGRVQNPTMIFRMLGVDVAAFQKRYGTDTIMPPEISEAIQAVAASGQYKLPRTKIWLFPTTRPGELLCNCTRIVGADGRELNTLLYEDFTEAEVEGRRQANEYARFFRDKLVGFGEAFVEDTGVQVGVRQTRQAAGVSRLGNADVMAGRKFADGIARSPWPIELHSGERPKVEWLIEDVYEIPYGCFVPERGDGLLVAGRCLSAEHEAVASARVTAQCFSYGQAIGLAAAIASQERVSPREISGSALRGLLNRQGAELG